MIFIRTLFHQPAEGRICGRYHKIIQDMQQVKSHFNHPFKALCFGKDNYELCKSEGFDAVQIWDESSKYLLSEDDSKSQIYQNKVWAIEWAMEEYGEPIIYLDWDCLPIKPFKIDDLVFKNDFAANLMWYKRPKCWWRKDKEDWNLVPNGGFVYIGTQSMIDKIWQAQKDTAQANQGCHNDEPFYMKAIDDLEGGWIGKDKWLQKYESPYSVLNKNGIFSDPNAIFCHYIGYKHTRFGRIHA